MAATATQPVSARDILRGLSADALRARLQELEGEAKAVRTLLRAANRMRPASKRKPEGGDRDK
jgi:hypothetical protein